MENISKHITYSEGVHSDTATRRNITNSPDPSQLENMKLLAEKVFEPARLYFNEPIYINSFFRSTTLNQAIGGSSSSQHCEGRAFDCRFAHGSKRMNSELFYYIMNNLEFDQLIWEFGTDSSPAWVHVSYHEGNNRKQVLQAKRIQGVVKYIPFN